jgi:hypothetical protein
MKNFILTLLILSLPIIGSAEQGKKTYKQGHATKNKEMFSGYNSPARINIEDGANIYVRPSLIYWQGKEKGLAIASIAVNGVTTTPPIDSYLKTPDFKYKPGFKVAVGKSFDRDDWYTEINYTFFHPSASVSLNTLSSASVLETLIWTSGVSTFYSATGTWNLKNDIIDAELGRSYYLGTKITLTPFISLRGGWLNQTYNLDYYGLTGMLIAAHSSIKAKSDSWLIGPRVGLIGNFLFGKTFKLFANSHVSLLYQDFSVRITERDYQNAALNSLSTIKLNDGFLTPNLKLGLGTGWGDYFFNNRIHFELTASYDFEVYFEQNVMSYLTNVNKHNNFREVFENLYLHGLTIDFRLDF